MSYESQLDNQSGKLINPAKLCLLISIALHLLVLKFGLPTIRFNNDSGRREVSIIELNPEQQSRLPNLYPQLQTPDQENIPDLTNLPELDSSDPAAPFAIPPNLIPGIGDPANLPPLTIPPPPTFNLPPLPPITDITLPPIGDLSDLPLPPTVNLEDFQVEPIKLPPDFGKTPDKPVDAPTLEQPTKPVKPPTTATKPEPNKQPETKPQPTPEQIAAKKAADSQQRLSNLRQSLTRSEVGTSDEDARKNYIVWLAKVQDVEPDQIEITGTYPRDACIRRLKGSSVFGVVVNAQGEVVALDLIKGAKYPIFNQQGSKDLGDRILDNETGKPKPYQVKVNYEYDSEICPSLTLPSIRRAEEKQKQQTEPIPAPAPKPQPEPKPEPVPAPKPQPEPKPEPVPAPEPKPEPKPVPKPVPAPKPAPELKPLPSLRDRLRNIPLPDRKPVDFKDIPLPERPNFRK